MIVRRSHLARPNGIFFFARRRLLVVICAPLSLACGSADSPVGVLPPPRDFIIDMRYLSTLSATQRTIVEAAVDKWTRALAKDRGEFRFNAAANRCFPGQPHLDETHNSPVVFLTVDDVDGPGRLLAYTQVCEVNPRDTLPILSHIRIDRADIGDLEETQTLRGVVIHELGHVLGFVPVSYVQKRLVGGGAADPYISGATARAEFAKHGAWYTGVAVPLEDAGGEGPYNPHWRFMVFGDEVMSSSIITGYHSPLSVITLGLFQDLGYNVDFAVADPYEVRPLFPDNRVLPGFSLANDVRPVTPPPSQAPLVQR